MPLLKRKPFKMVDPPPDLKPNERVYQIRFTKEIFRDYEEYVKRINLYSQRLWTCKATGRMNLTYEEALVLERRAIEKAEQLPKELIVIVLETVQFSTLTLRDLVSSVADKLHTILLEGEEMYGKKEDTIVPCKILKILENSYCEVAWLDKNNQTSHISVERADTLTRKKLSFTRGMLKSFIRESTSRNCPWVVHEKLALKHGLPTDPPEDVKSRIDRSGHHNRNIQRKRVMTEDGKEILRKRMKTKASPCIESGDLEKHMMTEELKIKPVIYPIEDLLVEPCLSDPSISNRPALSVDFAVPMDCVGNLLMIWDFLTSFCKVLHLWPFSLDDFSNAIIHKGSDVNIIVEAHAALFYLVLKEKGKYFNQIQGRRRKSKITFTNWTTYLCDFLEMEGAEELSTHTSTIKRGHYGVLDVHAKLGILRYLVEYCIESDIIRAQLEEHMEKLQALTTTKRETQAKNLRNMKEQMSNHVANGKVEPQYVSFENGFSKQDTSRRLEGQASSENCFMSHGKNCSKNGLRKFGISYLRRKSIKQEPAGIADEVELKNRPAMGVCNLIKQRETKEKETNPKKLKEHMEQLFEMEIEKFLIRRSPLGKDRNHDRYWFFRRDGRLFIESSVHNQWGYYCTIEEINKLMECLNPKGERERALKKQIERHYPKICSAMQKRSKEVALSLAAGEECLRRSVRVKSRPKESLTPSFLRYENRWKECRS